MNLQTSVSVEKATIIEDLNIHFDNPQDPLRAAFVSILDSVGLHDNLT